VPVIQDTPADAQLRLPWLGFDQRPDTVKVRGMTGGIRPNDTTA